MVRDVEQPRLCRLGLVCGDGVLLEDLGTSISDPVHPRLHHLPRHVLIDLGGDSQAVGEKERSMTPLHWRRSQGP